MYEYEKVAKIHIELEKMNIALPDGNSLLESSRQRCQKSKELWEARNFAEAYHEAERSLRPLRILMRAHWEKAVRGMDSPVSSPYAVSFYTLPKHWHFMNQKTNATVGGNVLRGGDFELPPQRVQDTWKLEKASLDEVVMLAERVTDLRVQRKETPDPKAKPSEPKAGEGPIEGKQCLMMQIKPKSEKQNLQAWSERRWR